MQLDDLAEPIKAFHASHVEDSDEVEKTTISRKKTVDDVDEQEYISQTEEYESSPLSGRISEGNTTADIVDMDIDVQVCVGET